MRIAFTIWGNRISPVFDSARKLFIVETEDNEIISRQYELFETGTDSDLSEILNRLRINVLICGAISKNFSNIIETSETKLIPFITGHVDAVLESYLKNNEIPVDFFMPGCSTQYYRKRHGCNGFSNKRSQEVNMPRSDGTGPQGQGAGTGRNQGPCQGGRQQVRQDNGQRQGAGRGSGRGQGRGQGRKGR